MLESKINIFEKDGKLRYLYKEKERVPNDRREAYYLYETSNVVPQRIIEQGKEVIKEYVGRRVEENINRQKRKNRKHEQFEANPDFPIEVKCGRVILKGKIISATSDIVRVRLEAPKNYQGETEVAFGFASAMAGHYIFEGESDKFSGYAIKRAQGLLVKIYKEEARKRKHRKIVEISKDLNL